MKFFGNKNRAMVWSFRGLVVAIDVSMCAVCLAGIICYFMRVPLPDRSYGGPMSRTSYWAPVPALLLYKLLFWLVGVNLNVAALWHVLVSGFIGSLLMFVSLALDSEQCGPGAFLVFVWGAGCSVVVPTLTRILLDSRTALLLTEAGVPAALALCWVLGRLMHSD